MRLLRSSQRGARNAAHRHHDSAAEGIADRIVTISEGGRLANAVPGQHVRARRDPRMAPDSERLLRDVDEPQGSIARRRDAPRASAPPTAHRRRTSPRPNELDPRSTTIPRRRSRSCVTSRSPTAPATRSASCSLLRPWSSARVASSPWSGGREREDDAPASPRRGRASNACRTALAADVPYSRWAAATVAVAASAKLVSTAKSNWASTIIRRRLRSPSGRGCPTARGTRSHRRACTLPIDVGSG